MNQGVFLKGFQNFNQFSNFNNGGQNGPSGGTGGSMSFKDELMSSNSEMMDMAKSIYQTAKVNGQELDHAKDLAMVNKIDQQTLTTMTAKTQMSFMLFKETLQATTQAVQELTRMQV